MEAFALVRGLYCGWQQFAAGSKECEEACWLLWHVAMSVWVCVQAQSLMQLPRLARALARERELLSAVDLHAKNETSLVPSSTPAIV